MKLRQLLVCLGLSFSGLVATSNALANPGKEIVLGQTAVLNGPLGAKTLEFNAGAKLAFDDINANGGIGGRSVRLLSLDDQVKPDLALANYKRLIEQEKVFALFGCVGTATLGAAADYLRQSETPALGFFGVGDVMRERVKGVVHMLRATTEDELQALVKSIKPLGHTRIAVAVIDNPGAPDAIRVIEKVLKENELMLAGNVKVKEDGSNSAASGEKLADMKPHAVLLYLSGSLPIEMIKSLRARGDLSQIFGTSIVLGNVLAKGLGADARGITLAQVVPYPFNPAAADAEIRKFRSLATAAKVEITYAALEGYVNARVFAKVAEKAGRELSSVQFATALKRFKGRYMGMDIDFTDPKTSTGSHFVELVQLSRDGKYVH